MTDTVSLADIEAALARTPDDVDLLYLRAGRLAAIGRSDDARAAYLATLARANTHFGALNDLATLLYDTGHRAAARTAYAQAVLHHPDNPIGHINLANALLAVGQIAEARTHYGIALTLAPNHPDAHQGLANLLQDAGEEDAAETHRQLSYRARTIVTLPYRGIGTPCRLLQLVSAVGGNTPTRFLLDDTVFETSTLVVEAHTAEAGLPPHDVIFNAVGDADLCATALADAERVLAHTMAPVINPPSRIRPTGRGEIARRLSGLPGVVTPRIIQCPRDEIAQAARALDYPVLVRSPGHHTGRHFVRIERAEDLAAATAPLPGADFLAIQPLDARGPDGLHRKYRVMFVGGRLHPLHLATSADWKVHYFTADMAEAPERRAADAAFLADMPGTLGPIAMAALTAIGERLDLDYGGMDFGLGPDGEVLVFEANTTMVVKSAGRRSALELPPRADPFDDPGRCP